MSEPSTGAKPDYKKTLNLPKTGFPMKANLVQNEPASLKRWGKLGGGAGLYEAMQEASAGRERFVFHDGPPYANGSIHLGHLMNKCLKDFVVRTKFMAGYACPYVPGWDCHGLPIEHRVVTDMVESGKIAKLEGLDDDARRMAIRRACQAYAEKQIKLQRGQMERLLTCADYEHPYLTMTPDYEAGVLDVLARLLEQGLVYKALKPVHWSIANETALADAELEYFDREDLSVYVDFEAADPGAVFDAFGLDAADHPGQTPSFMIWTTTPWTLPANLAIAVHERFEYALVRVDGSVTVLASGLAEKVCAAAGAEAVEVLATAPGSSLLGLRYRHPFVDAPPRPATDPDADTSRCYVVIGAEYVTLEDGTGLVHTAPGHGADDYMSGRRAGLPVYCPVQGDGRYDRTVPEWLRGVDVFEANEQIARRLTDSGHLFYSHRFTHSYPHDWRSKTPVIFRCTEQWFVGVDRPTARDGRSLRDMALGSVAPEGAVAFVPGWGRNRMRGMLEARPDWCISRQRAWGLPIPAFELPDGTPFMTSKSVDAVAAVVREHGSDAWFLRPPHELLAGYDGAADEEAPEAVRSGAVALDALQKGHDILDVWFESGSSWNAVMRQRSGGADFPVALYLEGSDQHRGWFQLSLLPSLGMMGTAPFQAILTHGFMVGKDGRKLSKSAGHTIENLFQHYGADVLRWWVSSLAYENDVKVDESFFKLAGESYRKVRNTLRFMLSNLGDFDGADAGGHAPDALGAVALHRFDQLSERVTSAYAAYDFRAAHLALYDFCNEDLSATYLAAVKDRLYCDRPDAPRRRRTQAVLHRLTDGLCRLLAPVLCHTADEAYRALHGDDACVHLAGHAERHPVDPPRGWEEVFERRHQAMKALEDAKRAEDAGGPGLENPLDTGLVVPDPDGAVARFGVEDFADLCGVSRVSIDADADAVEVVDLRAEPRCERSWKRDGTVRERSDGGLLSDRDAQAVGVA